MRTRRFSGFTSGANINNVRIWACAGCGTWHRGAKPKQCQACGRLDFTKFDSIAEAKRYGELALEHAHKLIADLEVQKRFDLTVHGQKIGAYIADFAYRRDGQRILEDVKGGADTALSAWKRKHVEAEYGVKVNVVIR